MNQAELKIANRRAAIRWGSFVVGLLSLQVLGGIFAIMLATGDESVAVVPNYHQKALNWDQEVEALAASAALGWKCDVSETGMGQDASGHDASGLRITLVDRDGEPVQVVSGELKYYRHVRAGDERSVAIPAGSFALMELPNCFEAPGLWQVSIALEGVDGEKFLHSQELTVEMKDGMDGVAVTSGPDNG